MSIISVRAEMECDDCKAVATIIARNLTQVRPKARSQGWGIGPGNKDICVNCVVKRERKAKSCPP